MATRTGYEVRNVDGKLMAVPDKTFTGTETGSDVLSATSPTYTGAITASGGVAGGASRFPTWVPGALTEGTDTTPVAGTVYYAGLFLPANATITGIGYLIGSAGGTDKAIASLYDAAGALVASSALAGVTVGTLATYQELPFTAPYAAVGPAQYFVGISMNGTTARLRTIAAVGGWVLSDSATGVFGTLAAITPPTAFSAGEGPIAYSY